MGKIITIGICVCALCILFRENQRPFIVILEISFAVFAMLLFAGDIFETLKKLRDVFSIEKDMGDVFSCLMKGALICIGTKLAADICSENGNRFVADIIDISGRVALLIITLPFIESIVETAMGFVS